MELAKALEVVIEIGLSALKLTQLAQVLAFLW